MATFDLIIRISSIADVPILRAMETISIIPDVVVPSPFVFVRDLSLSGEDIDWDANERTQFEGSNCWLYEIGRFRILCSF
jgi:hypothetical protein